MKRVYIYQSNFTQSFIEQKPYKDSFFLLLLGWACSRTWLYRRNSVSPDFKKMARMYSRKHGKATSHKPVDKTVPSWVSYKPGEVEQLIVKFAKQEHSSSQIGMILRDSYGIPCVKALLGKGISEVMKDKKVYKQLPEDLLHLIQKHIAVMKHLEENHHDMTAKRGMQLTESKIKRLVKYYKKKGVLEAEWMYDKKRAKLFVE